MFSSFIYHWKRRFEFKKDHGEWVSTVKPKLGPEISQRVSEALRFTGDGADICHSVKEELHDALTALLGVLFYYWILITVEFGRIRSI